MINTKRLIETFCELVSIDSPSLGERRICDYLSGCLRDLGFQVEEDCAGTLLGGDSGNLYGYLEGTCAAGEPVLFSAHMDTVEPACGKKAVLHEDGRITSDGDTVLGADDFAGVSAILEALRSIRDQKLAHRPIEVLFTVAEELYCRGVTHFDCTKLKSREAYVPDLAGEVGTAANKAPSILTFCVEVTGRAAHAGFAPQDGSHAIAAAAEAVGRLRMGRIDAQTTCNIGQIEGGTARNIIPERCIVKGEIRSYSHTRALEVAGDVETAFKAAAKAYGADAEMREELLMEAYETGAEEPVTKRYKAACEALGLPFSLTPTFGGSDNNHLAKQGISGLVVACGMNGCHSPAEYTTVEELRRSAELILTLMTDTAHIL